jgi:ATP-binding cassette subfamily C protein
MRLLVTFVRRYPWQSLAVLAALLAAGALEGMSLTALVPVVSAALGGGLVPADGEGGAALGAAGAAVVRAVSALGFTPSLPALGVVVLVGVVLRSAALLVAMRQVGYTVARVATDLRLELLRALLATRWEYFLRQPVGRLTNAVATEAYRASQAYLKGATLATSAVQLLVATGVALFVSWRATLVYLAAAATVSAVLYVLVRVAKRSGKRQTKIARNLLASMTDLLQSVKPLKAMGRQDLSDAVLAGQARALDRAIRREVLSKEGLRAVQEPVFAILIAAAVWAGLAHWKLPAPTVLVLAVLLARVLGGIRKVQSAYQDVVVLESAFWSLRATIDEAQQAVEVATGTKPPRLERAIRFDAVHFDYEGHPVLHGLSLEIPAGSLTALVGLSGAGKTTIVDLVIGLVRPQRGRVLVDGVPLEEIDLLAWRRACGYVPQENLLLHDTVLHNVTLGDPEVPRAEVERALRAANAWEFVSRLPRGLDTPVGERGGRFSGGQRQRLLIARALVRRPRLLILDEATSALDPASARALAATLRDLRGEMTILAISHQPDLVEAADRVYRLERGRATLDRGPGGLPAAGAAAAGS